MSLMHVVASQVDRIDGDVAVAFFFEDERPVGGPAALLDLRLNGRLTDLIAAGTARGRAGEQVLIQGNGKIAAPWVFFIGGGSWKGLGEETYRNLLRHLARSCSAAGLKQIALGLAAPEGIPPEKMPTMVEMAVRDIAPVLEWSLGLQCLAGSTEKQINYLAQGTG